MCWPSAGGVRLRSPQYTRVGWRTWRASASVITWRRMLSPAKYSAMNCCCTAASAGCWYSAWRTITASSVRRSGLARMRAMRVCTLSKLGLRSTSSELCRLLAQSGST
ncbi:hypothetical protein D3C72_2270380 [compost metagenome]